MYNTVSLLLFSFFLKASNEKFIRGRMIKKEY